jgi:hypothetical protein
MKKEEVIFIISKRSSYILCVMKVCSSAFSRLKSRDVTSQESVFDMQTEFYVERVVCACFV